VRERILERDRCKRSILEAIHEAEEYSLLAHQHCVVRSQPDVSEDHTACVFGVEKYARQDNIKSRRQARISFIECQQNGGWTKSIIRSRFDADNEINKQTALLGSI
jgi:hypothetical protein